MMFKQPFYQHLEKLFIAFYNHLEQKKEKWFRSFLFWSFLTQMKKETNEKNSFVHEKRVNICTKHSSIEYYGVVIVLKTADHRYSKYANVIALIT